MRAIWLFAAAVGIGCGHASDAPKQGEKAAMPAVPAPPAMSPDPRAAIPGAAVSPHDTPALPVDGAVAPAPDAEADRPAAPPDARPLDQIPTPTPTPTPTPPPTATLAFVGGDNGNVHVYGFDPATCALTPKSMLFAAKPAWYGAIDSKGQHLYIGSLVEGKVLAYAIDRAGARLTLVNSITVAGSPAHIALDRTDKFLFVSAFGGGRVFVLPIRADGGVTEGMSYATGRSPHSTAIDPGNKFLFVQNMGSDSVSQFAFEGGRLVPANPPALMLPGKIGPRSGAFHPRLPYYYTANELGSSVSAYALDSGGTLRLLDTRTALPMGFSGTSYAAEVHLSPSGKFAYVSNRGADTIAVFGVDQATGKLTAAAQIPAGGKNPQSQAWDASGQRLLSANTDGRSVVCFAVDDATGLLTSKSTTTLDTKALWVGVLPR